MSSLSKDLRAQANQHPLDADLGMFNVAAAEIDRLQARVDDLSKKLDQALEHLTVEQRAMILCQWGGSVAMADITMCINGSCPLKLRCYRQTAPPNEHRQAYAEFAPDVDGCESFYPDPRRQYVEAQD